MKPYPFSPLNHFTVPCATVVLLLRWERIDGRPCAGHRAAAVFDVPPRSGAPREAHRRGPVRMTPAAVDGLAPVDVRELQLQPGATLAPTPGPRLPHQGGVLGRNGTIRPARAERPCRGLAPSLACAPFGVGTWALRHGSVPGAEHLRVEEAWARERRRDAA